MKKKLKQIPIADRPREKMIKRGAGSLSNLELLAILLQSGIKGRDVLELAGDVLKSVEQNFHSISTDTFMKVHGIGVVKAAQITAAIELAKRFISRDGTRITSPGDVLSLVDDLKNKQQEHFITLTVDGGSNLIQKRTVFIGTVNKSIIHPREVFADAITDRAASIFLVHNHPSGNVEPSDNDINVTKCLVEVGHIVGIEVMDHIIVGRNAYYSFMENGLIIC